MNQPAKPVDMRDRMPKTAQWIAERRLEWGKEHVNDCLRRAAVGGEPGQFYAIEGGHVTGTPFPADHAVAELQRYAVLTACTFAAFMRQPDGVQTPAQGASHAN